MIFKSILEKVKFFENSYLKKQKEEILDKLIKKRTSTSSNNWYIIHCVIVGVTLANLVNNIFLSGTVGFWSTTFSVIYLTGAISFIVAYLNRNKTKETVINSISNSETLRDLYQYINGLNSAYLFDNFIFENSSKNLKEISENLAKINIVDIKSLLSKFTEDEVITIKEILKEHIKKDYIESNVIYSLTTKCEKEIEESEKEENFMNAFKEDKEEEKDLIDIMMEECNLERKEKINFKEVL